MEEEKPNIKTWNYDNEQLDSSPEMQKQQTVDWSAVGESISNDVTERHTIKWYFNAPLVFIILVISYFGFNFIGAILVLIFMFRIIISSIKSNDRPGKLWSILGWIFITMLFLGFVLII